MNSADWEKAKEIFADAIEWTSDERESRLRAACEGNDELYGEVSSLLAAHDGESHLIEKHALKFVGETTSEGRVFGHYRIVREIGRGGMGAVFLAERSDGEFDQRVALKIVRETFFSEDLERHFRRERQILASLGHPNIARLLDGGVSANGEPFIAMEFVDGKTILEFAHSLALEDKLRLFVKLCGAVDYLHRNLVVHRDIKPSNILVGADGEPKLLDFGLAKLDIADAGERSVVRALTPAYASPEQLAGGNVTTASDVYSLGVVLYELLSGRKPHDFENKSLEQILASITASEPPPLGTLAESNVPAEKLRGDLENIVGVALRREPERRYASVAALTDDLNRYLDRRPVSARPNTFKYRASKFVARNKIAVAAAAFVVIAIASGVGIALWQANVARRERDRAEKRFNDVRKLSNSLLFEITPRIERLSGSMEARKILVERALEYLDSLAGEAQDDPELRSELASAYEKIGEIQGNVHKPNLGDFDGADRSLEKAREIRLGLEKTLENKRLLAENYRLSSDVQFARTDVEKSFASSVEALRIYDELLTENPQRTDLKNASIDTEIEYGASFSSNGEYEKSIAIFRKVAGRIGELNPDEPDAKRLMAKNLALLGDALSWNDRQAEAEVEIRRATALADDLVARLPNDNFVRQSAIQVYTLGSTDFEDANNAESLRLGEKAYALSRFEAESDPANFYARFNLARAISRIGLCYMNLGKNREALAQLDAARTTLTPIVEQNSANAYYQRTMAITLQRIGDVSLKLGAERDALKSYGDAVKIFESIASGNENNLLARRELALGLKLLAGSAVKVGETETARESFERALKIFRDLDERKSLAASDRKMIDEISVALTKIPPAG